ncbi:MAG: flagellar hook-basal body complex protein FliE [Proteobacteria bacterium]|nr:flagellar hook-basal body complex protein FliE [Pseudomonadota bacterium]
MSQIIPPLAHIGPVRGAMLAGAPQPAGPTAGPSFAQVLMQGIDTTTTKLAAADQLAARAAVDSSVPLHQVTFALEEARIAFEMMIQVRNRLVDATQQLTNLQL